jgi:hypothetical protein
MLMIGADVAIEKIKTIIRKSILEKIKTDLKIKIEESKVRFIIEELMNKA